MNKIILILIAIAVISLIGLTLEMVPDSEHVILSCEPVAVSTTDQTYSTTPFWTATKFVIPSDTTLLTAAKVGFWFTECGNVGHYYSNIGFSDSLTINENDWAVMIREGEYGWGGGDWSYRRGLNNVEVPVTPGEEWYLITKYDISAGWSNYKLADGAICGVSQYVMANEYSSFNLLTAQSFAFEISGATAESVNANFIFSPSNPIPDEWVQFTDTSSSDFTITSYLWDFGDGGSSTEQNPSHTYDVEGTYDVSLTVTTSTGMYDTAYMQIPVTEYPILDELDYSWIVLITTAISGLSSIYVYWKYKFVKWIIIPIAWFIGSIIYYVI